MNKIIATRFVISGRVQGVFFRASTRAEAERLGLRGYAINRPDGSVEVLVGGTEEAIASLAVWLESGPPMANVQQVEATLAEPAELAHESGFRCG